MNKVKNKKYSEMNINEKINYRSSKSFLRSLNNFGLDFGFCLASLELKKLSWNTPYSFKEKRVLVLARKIKKQYRINSLYQLLK